ncbi:MAG: nucleotidyltransferase domain-containing protein [Candidatus Sabulitectum sp.]|nr:nucleotidyltransferase domain-containing protein [Candidatus Sabulitectum sp.]
MQKILERNISALRNLCLAFRVKKLYVFGSAVSGNFRDDSDIDFLLTLSEDLTIQEYTDNYFSLQHKLRELFGREIDIVTERTLSNPYFIESIDETRELIYEA